MIPTNLSFRPLAALLSFGLVTACSDSGVKVHNSAPSVDITSHSDGDTETEGDVVTFMGAIGDNESGPDELKATWYIGSEVACEEAAPDSSGTTTCDVVVGVDDTDIILVGVDPKHASSDDSVTFSVTPTDAPEATIVLPDGTGVDGTGVYYSDQKITFQGLVSDCLLYTSPSPRDVEESRMPSSA